jgi:signal transduction histidine kinase
VGIHYGDAEDEIMSQQNDQNLLDAIGHGILVFDDEGNLVQHNNSAGTLLGLDLSTIKTSGWQVAESLFNAGITEPDDMMGAVRTRALSSEKPIRFHIFRSGKYVPCWASALPQDNGKLYLLITLDVTDWSLVNNVIERFRHEMREAVESTLGHINLINRTMLTDDEEEDPAVAKLSKRIGGFTRLIGIHMQRAERLMGMLERLEDIRTGKIHDIIRAERRKIDLEDFMEDFMEELNEIDLLDPETEVQDYQARIELDMPKSFDVYGVRSYLRATLQELLRNAIMYSLRGSPVRIKVYEQTPNIIIDVIDEGYGVRQKSWERVFEPFQRGHQPQIISEFGYGLSLHLCKNEIDAMNGRLWFKTEENVGSTFKIRLPQWRENEASSASDA